MHLRLASLSALLLIAVPALAAAEPAPTTQLELSAGASAAFTSVTNSNAETTKGGGAGLILDVAYSPTPTLGVVIDGWALWIDPGECAADASCYNGVAERQDFATAGLRWRPTATLYVQGTGGLAISRDDHNDPGGQIPLTTYYSPAAVVAAGWRRHYDAFDLGAELRVGALKNEGTTVTNTGLVFNLGRSW